MDTIENILDRHVGKIPTRVELGDSFPSEVKDPVKPFTLDKDQFRRDLRIILDNRNKNFQICFAVILALIICEIILIFISINQPSYLKAASAFLGISVGSLVTKMITLVQEKTYLDLLLSLITNISDDKTIRLAVNSIRKKAIK